jgi:hypothetical protein
LSGRLSMQRRLMVVLPSASRFNTKVIGHTISALSHFEIIPIFSIESRIFWRHPTS